MRLEAELDYLEAKRILDKSYDALSRRRPIVSPIAAELDYLEGKRVLDKSYQVLRDAQAAYDSATALYGSAFLRRYPDYDAYYSYLYPTWKKPLYDAKYYEDHKRQLRLRYPELYDLYFDRSRSATTYQPYSHYSPTKYEPLSPRKSSPYLGRLSPFRYPSLTDYPPYSGRSYISPPRTRLAEDLEYLKTPKKHFSFVDE